MAQEVIELGDTDAEPAPERGLPPSRWARPVAVAVALMLAALPGASAPPGPLVTQVGGVALDRSGGPVAIRTLGDLLLVRDARDVSAYELADGSLRWRRPAEGADLRLADLPASAPESLLLLSGEPSGGPTASAMVDLATGRTRWSAPGSVQVVGDLAVEHPSTPRPSAVAAAAMELPIRELHTGRIRWTLRGAPYADVDATAGEAWSVSPQGRLTVYGLPDGKVLRTGQVAFPPGTPEGARVSDGTLRLSSMDRGVARTVRYDSRTLRETGVPDGVRRYPCGPYLCEVRGVLGGPLAVLDFATRAVRHRLPEYEHLLLTDIGPVALRIDQPVALGDQQVTLVASAGRLLDLGDGRTMLDLTGWGALTDLDGRPSLLLVRRIPGALQLARIEGGEVRVLGAVRPDPIGCWFAQPRLACEYDDQVLLWRITW